MEDYTNLILALSQFIVAIATLVGIFYNISKTNQVNGNLMQLLTATDRTAKTEGKIEILEKVMTPQGDKKTTIIHKEDERRKS